ncbi:hypothetical protein AB0K51_12425 [Kitasatospora sp. NPDC049285]|uniref:hypothetical protein n=1 Tax=Kitasatospora sp. NPDC049285 TaxID=3157096 RepID=UPI0034163B77
MDTYDRQLLAAYRKHRLVPGPPPARVRCPSRCAYEFGITPDGWQGVWRPDGSQVTNASFTDDELEQGWGDCWRGLTRVMGLWLAEQGVTLPHAEQADSPLPQDIADYLDHTRTHRVHLLQQALDPHRMADPGAGPRSLHQPEVDRIEEHFPRLWSEHGRYRIRVQVRVEVTAERIES